MIVDGRTCVVKSRVEQEHATTAADRIRRMTATKALRGQQKRRAKEKKLPTQSPSTASASSSSSLPAVPTSVPGTANEETGRSAGRTVIDRGLVAPPDSPVAGNLDGSSSTTGPPKVTSVDSITTPSAVSTGQSAPASQNLKGGDPISSDDDVPDGDDGGGDDGDELYEPNEFDADDELGGSSDPENEDERMEIEPGSLGNPARPAADGSVYSGVSRTT